MDEFSTTSDTLEEADEVILTPTASDDALEYAAGKEDNRGVGPATSANLGSSWVGCCCGG
jgi:hypothetical protein